LVAEAIARRFESVAATNYAARLDGDAKVAATSSISRTEAPGRGAPFAKAFALDYQFDEGWRFVRCEPEGGFHFGARPAALGVWVYGDGSGNALRLRVRDASGQTFQPSGPNLDWTGWRWVTFDLNGLPNAAHWGGANDGAPQGSLILDTALLLDSGKRKTAGRIYFTGVTAVYGKQ
jgi:hypothetical protein